MGPMLLDPQREVALQTGSHMTECAWVFSLTLGLSEKALGDGAYGGIKLVGGVVSRFLA